MKSKKVEYAILYLVAGPPGDEDKSGHDGHDDQPGHHGAAEQETRPASSQPITARQRLAALLDGPIMSVRGLSFLLGGFYSIQTFGRGGNCHFTVKVFVVALFYRIGTAALLNGSRSDLKAGPCMTDQLEGLTRASPYRDGQPAWTSPLRWDEWGGGGVTSGLAPHHYVTEVWGGGGRSGKGEETWTMLN